MTDKLAAAKYRLELDCRADDEACHKAGIPLYWCEAIGRYVTVPEKEN